MQIRCPQCKSELLQQGKSWHCANHHHFDSAKQGYTNLLLVQKKRSKSPGDDAAMVASRSRFLNSGHYHPLSEAINNLVIQNIHSSTAQHSSLSVLDAGCGEGYYTSRLSNALQSHSAKIDMTGIDISKFAIRTAAKRNKQCRWFVGNSSDLPVADNSCDVLLSLFSPIPRVEFSRVLATNGMLIVASTGRQHLFELRELLYDQVQDKVLEPATHLAPNFTHNSQQQLTFPLRLKDNTQILDLLAMTPHFWRATPERKQVLTQLSTLKVTVDVHLHCFTLTAPNEAIS